jgi:hypothetical protein
MQQLTSNVFVETQIRGCNHGFVTTSDGIVMIDTRTSPAMRRSWRRSKTRRLRYIIATGSGVLDGNTF